MEQMDIGILGREITHKKHKCVQIQTYKYKLRSLVHWFNLTTCLLSYEIYLIKVHAISLDLISLYHILTIYSVYNSSPFIWLCNKIMPTFLLIWSGFKTKLTRVIHLDIFHIRFFPLIQGIELPAFYSSKFAWIWHFPICCPNPDGSFQIRKQFPYNIQT